MCDVFTSIGIWRPIKSRLGRSYSLASRIINQKYNITNAILVA
jgi:hypothetical protein